MYTSRANPIQCDHPSLRWQTGSPPRARGADGHATHCLLLMLNTSVTLPLQPHISVCSVALVAHMPGCVKTVWNWLRLILVFRENNPELVLAAVPGQMLGSSAETRRLRICSPHCAWHITTRPCARCPPGWGMHCHCPSLQFHHERPKAKGQVKAVDRIRV